MPGLFPATAYAEHIGKAHRNHTAGIVAQKRAVVQSELRQHGQSGYLAGGIPRFKHKGCVASRLRQRIAVATPAAPVSA